MVYPVVGKSIPVHSIAMHVAIVGRSNIIGRPLAALLNREDATLACSCIILK